MGLAIGQPAQAVSLIGAEIKGEWDFRSVTFDPPTFVVKAGSESTISVGSTPLFDVDFSADQLVLTVENNSNIGISARIHAAVRRAIRSAELGCRLDPARCPIPARSLVDLTGLIVTRAIKSSSRSRPTQSCRCRPAAAVRHRLGMIGSSPGTGGNQRLPRRAACAIDSSARCASASRAARGVRRTLSAASASCSMARASRGAVQACSAASTSGLRRKCTGGTKPYSACVGARAGVERKPRLVQLRDLAQRRGHDRAGRGAGGERLGELRSPSRRCGRRRPRRPRASSASAEASATTASTSSSSTLSLPCA